MKKRIMILTAACLLLCVAFAGCGDAGKKVGSEIESTVSKAEDEAGSLLKEGEAALEGFVSEVQKDVKKVEDAVEMDGKAALEIIKEDANTIKYKFTVAEEAAATEVGELEKKAAGLEENIKEHLEAVKDKGVADVQAVVQFVDKEGKELYSKIFK